MLFQIDTTALAQTVAAQVEEPVQESINLWQMAQYGGWIMIILAILLAGACYIFIERLVVLKRATREDRSFMDRIRDYSKKAPDRLSPEKLKQITEANRAKRKAEYIAQRKQYLIEQEEATKKDLAEAEQKQASSSRKK